MNTPKDPFKKKLAINRSPWPTTTWNCSYLNVSIWKCIVHFTKILIRSNKHYLYRSNAERFSILYPWHEISCLVATRLFDTSIVLMVVSEWDISWVRASIFTANKYIFLMNECILCRWAGHKVDYVCIFYKTFCWLALSLHLYLLFEIPCQDTPFTSDNIENAVH